MYCGDKYVSCSRSSDWSTVPVGVVLIGQLFWLEFVLSGKSLAENVVSRGRDEARQTSTGGVVPPAMWLHLYVPIAVANFRIHEC